MANNGFLLIDKPEGPSSFDAVRRSRKVFNTKKVGHCGTLDPLASGLLIVAVGKATRLINDLSIEPKIYNFGIQFGKTTTTLDREGEVVKSGGLIPSEDEIKKILPSLTGKIDQTPPKYSAIKINGVPAYKLARKDKEFDIKSRTIEISNLTLFNYNNETGEADMQVKCSGGTYVRVLCEQIAKELNTYAYASYIRRLKIGEYSVDDAVSLEAKDEKIANSLSSLWDIFQDEPKAIITEEQQKEISHGREISIDCCDDDKIFLFNKEEELTAIAVKRGNDIYGPKKVFI